MTVEDSDVPTGSVPDHPPVTHHPPPPVPSRQRPNPLGVLVSAAIVALAGVAAITSVGIYLSRDRTASSPMAQTVTVTKSAKVPTSADGADGVFLSSLANYGLADNGSEAVRQRFMEFGHQICFSLLLPQPRSLETLVDNILTAENQDITADPWAPHFSHDDAEHLALAAIGAFCPNAQK
jgi:hypothetical protein